MKALGKLHLHRLTYRSGIAPTPAEFFIRNVYPIFILLTAYAYAYAYLLFMFHDDKNRII